MPVIAAILHSIAFAIALFVQFWASPLAGAWVFFHLAGCAVLLYGGQYPAHKGPLWGLTLAWLLAVTTSAFLFAPVRGGAATMWVLASTPMLALCLRKEHLKPYTAGFLAVGSCYAIGLVIQMALHTQTTAYNYEGRHAWPLLDPNNAAAVVNLAFLPCIWLSLSKDRRWSLLVALFALALYATGSKAGFCVAALGSLVMLSARYGAQVLLFAFCVAAFCAPAVFTYRPDLIVLMAHSFADRFPIWEASVQLLAIRPLLGVGFGAFSYYYEQVRIEQYTAGWHSHNDVLQVAIEAGIPAGVIFCLLLAAVAFTTRRINLAAGCAFTAITLQSMVEFQFYIPAVSLPLGLALAWHMLTPSRKASL